MDKDALVASFGNSSRNINFGHVPKEAGEKLLIDSLMIFITSISLPFVVIRHYHEWDEVKIFIFLTAVFLLALSFMPDIIGKIYVEKSFYPGFSFLMVLLYIMVITALLSSAQSVHNKFVSLNDPNWNFFLANYGWYILINVAVLVTSPKLFSFIKGKIKA